MVSDRCGVAEFLPASGRRVVRFGDREELRSALNWALGSEAREAAASGVGEVRMRLAWPAIAAEQAQIYERLPQ